MKRLFLVVFAIFLFSTVPAHAAVQFSSVNPVMQAIAATVTANDDLVDWAKPAFDEKFSDLPKERLKYDLTGDMKKTLWGNGARAGAYGSCVLIAQRTGTRVGIHVTSTMGLRTDVLAFLRYGATVALGKLDRHGKFAGRVSEQLQRLMTAQDLATVYSALLAGQSLADEIIKDEMVHSNSVNWAAARDAYAQTTITPISTNGVVTALELRNAVSAAGFDTTYPGLAVTPEALTLRLTAAEVKGVLTGFSPQGPDDLDRLHRDLGKILEGLQANTPTDKANAFRVFSEALGEFKRVIQGDVSK